MAKGSGGKGKAQGGDRGFPRGIAPALLVEQVRGAMPYLFDDATGGALARDFPPARVVREYAATIVGGEGTALDHFEYFRLCLSAHYLSCGTPVPTDVDNQIRLKLWPRKLPLSLALPMAELVLESRNWDFTRVSTRFVTGAAGTPWEREQLGGHHGEWFTVACAAYAALRDSTNAAAVACQGELRAAIGAEVAREAEIFGSLWRARDGLGCLRAAASIAHNLGDLDRVMDMWELPVGDPLRLAFYKLGTSPFDSDRQLRYQGRLWVAGELYKEKIEGKSSMALENHRHFALRKPRALRRHPDLVVPTAPFFDAWGERIAELLGGEAEDDLREIVAVLAEGWERQPGTVAYGRALAGIFARRPEFAVRFEDREHQAVLETPRAEFEARWARVAAERVDDIPSRAE